MVYLTRDYDNARFYEWELLWLVLALFIAARARTTHKVGWLGRWVSVGAWMIWVGDWQACGWVSERLQLYEVKTMVLWQLYRT